MSIGQHVDIEVRADTHNATGTLREIEYILYRSLSLLNRLGLPPEIDAAINKVERMIFLVRVLHSTLAFLAWGSPLGLIYAGLAGAGGIISTVDLLNNMG
jgi:hypothetical protein